MDIAVVDDKKAIREHICALVEEQQPGNVIEAYATGEELLASGKRFDIVFLDIQMDGMNGIEAARELRGRRRWMQRHQKVLSMLDNMFGIKNEA